MERLVSDNIPMLLALEGKEAKTREASKEEFAKLLKQELLAKVNRFLTDTDSDTKLKLLADIYLIIQTFEGEADRFLREKGQGFDSYLRERALYVGEYKKRLILTDIVKEKEKTDDEKRTELMSYGEKYGWPAIVLSGTKENPLKVLGPGEDKWRNALSWFDVSRDNVAEWLRATRMDARIGG